MHHPRSFIEKYHFTKDTDLVPATVAASAEPLEQNTAACGIPVRSPIKFST